MSFEVKEHAAPMPALAPEPKHDERPICPVCQKPIEPHESTGTVDGKFAHLDCWIKRRREGDRPPRR